MAHGESFEAFDISGAKALYQHANGHLPSYRAMARVMSWPFNAAPHKVALWACSSAVRPPNGQRPNTMCSLHTSPAKFLLGLAYPYQGSQCLNTQGTSKHSACQDRTYPAPPSMCIGLQVIQCVHCTPYYVLSFPRFLQHFHQHCTQATQMLHHTPLFLYPRTAAATALAAAEPPAPPAATAPAIQQPHQPLSLPSCRSLLHCHTLSLLHFPCSPSPSSSGSAPT